MRIDLKFTQFHSTPDVEEYARRKINALERNVKIFEKEGELAVFVEIAKTTKHHRKGDVFYAETTLVLPGKVIRATHTGVDMRVAIDKMKEKLKREIVQHKEKTKSKRRVNKKIGARS